MSSEEEEDEEEDDSGEELDPRIREKLEELNHWTDNINKLEKQFEETNALFRNTLNDCSIRLRKIGQKLGKCVEDSRPYYESKNKASTLQSRCQRAAIQFERSAQLHSQAKETITLAEDKFQTNQNTTDFDTVWQEMLNHATNKFMEAESLKKQSECEHSKCMTNYLDEERRLTALERQLKNAIKKSKPYYEESAKVQTELNNIKSKIETLSKTILESKKSYSKTLKDLENISEEIHEKRAHLIAKSLKREPGVGAEFQITNESETVANEVPQLELDKQLNELQAITSPLPNSHAIRSPLCLSPFSSTSEDDNQIFAFNTSFDTNIDNNGNSGHNDSNLEEAFVEIDLNNS